MTILLLSAFLSAAAPASPVPFAQAPKGLRLLVHALQKAAKRRDAATVYRHLAPDYYISRDMGGTFDPKASAVENFSWAFQFDDEQLMPEYAGYGWRRFLEELTPAPFDQTADGQFCMPAGASDAEPLPLPQLCFRKSPDGAWLIAGHANGGD